MILGVLQLLPDLFGLVLHAIELPIEFDFLLLAEENRSHGVGVGALVSRRVAPHHFTEGVAHASEQNATLAALHGHLPHELVEAFVVDATTAIAKADFQRVHEFQPLVEVSLEELHVDSRGRMSRDTCDLHGQRARGALRRTPTYL